MIQSGIVGSQDEAGRYCVTFLDNHDRHRRYFYRDPAGPDRFADQVGLAVVSLFELRGNPRLYHGTEQGLNGAGDRPEAVLWGKLVAVDRAKPAYRAIRALASATDRDPVPAPGRVVG